MAWNSDTIARYLFVASLPALAFVYGVAAEHYSLFPVPRMKAAKTAAEQLWSSSGPGLPWYFETTDRDGGTTVYDFDALQPGLRMISGFTNDERMRIAVVDRHGAEVRAWRIEWDELWPNPDHLSEKMKPKRGVVLLHGVTILPDGDLLFNFTELGMVRMGPCGDVRWRLPYRTHHALSVTSDGHIWAPGMVTRQVSMPDRPNYAPPFDDYSIVEVSPDGELLRELFVYDLLEDAGLQGLLYMQSLGNRPEDVRGDVQHLNDVEVFPDTLEAGTFSPGDIMLSIRNANAIVVLDGETLQAKFASVGRFVRQHDPDFVDGNTISLLDNNNLAAPRTESMAGHYSRVVRLSTETGEVTVDFSGSEDQPFFTDIMGSHQRLANGNMLLVESLSGRVLEIDPDGNVLWEFVNVIRPGVTGLVDDAMVLPPEMDRAFFERLTAGCPSE